MGNQQSTRGSLSTPGASSDSLASITSIESDGSITPPQETSPVKGQVLMNKYEVKDILLGEGGFAKVKKGKCLQTGIAIAIKIMKNEETETDIQQRVGVKQERKVHCRLSHPNIVRFIDSFIHDDCVFIIQEFVPGGDLQEHLSEIPEHSLEEEKAAKLFYQLGNAMDYLHDLNIVHRDIKLENILLDETKNMAKITDFGFADFVDFSERFIDSCGTIEYVPPEVIYRRPSPDRRKMDVWALGVVLYCMLYGRPPFYGNDHKELFRKVLNVDVAFVGPRRMFVSPEANDLLRMMLTKNVVHRPGMKEVMNHQWMQLYRSRINQSLLHSIPRTPRHMGYPGKGSPLKNGRGAKISPTRNVRTPLSPLRTFHKKILGSPAKVSPNRQYGTPPQRTSKPGTPASGGTERTPQNRTPLQDQTGSHQNSPLSPSAAYCKTKLVKGGQQSPVISPSKPGTPPVRGPVTGLGSSPGTQKLAQRIDGSPSPAIKTPKKIITPLHRVAKHKTPMKYIPGGAVRPSPIIHQRVTKQSILEGSSMNGENNVIEQPITVRKLEL